MVPDVSTPPAPADPVVRFRLRSLLAVTTAVALLAAVAGPFYRQQPPAAQSKLLVFWGSVLIFGAFGLWSNWRTAWRAPATAFGEVHYMLWTARRRRSMLRRLPGKLLLAALWLGLIAVFSSEIVERNRRGYASTLFVILRGFNGGLFTGCCLMALTRRPAFLCEKGVVSGRAFGPWKYIRHAEWLADRPEVMKLRRLDGDIYVDVPAKLRDDVEAFVSERTRWVAPTDDGADASLRGAS